MKWIALALLLAALFFGAWQWHVTSNETQLCRAALAAALNAPRLEEWVAEAEADVFLAQKIFQGRPGALLVGVVSEARRLAFPSSLPIGMQKALGTLAGVKGDFVALGEALAALGREGAALKCAGESPALGAGETAKIREAQGEWEEARREASREREIFEVDRRIYCRARELESGLEKVLATQDLRCREGKLSPKAASACQGKNDVLNQELADLEKQREFNLHKLRQKWPEAVLAKELSCG